MNKTTIIIIAIVAVLAFWGIGAYSGLRTDTFTITRAALTSLTLSK